MAREKERSDTRLDKQGQLRTSGRVSKVPNIKSAPGVFNRNPSPGLSEYPATVGGADIDVKFAETGVGDASMQINQMRQPKGVNRRGLPKVPTSSNMNRKKNKYSSPGKTKQTP